MRGLTLIRKRSREIAVAVASTLALLAPNARASAAQSCGPFGDPPATVLGAPIPFCTGGTLLGPWPDGDATNRYSCLYEPAAAGANNPLPMVVFLHPSLGTSDTIKFTDLLSRIDAADLSGDLSKPGFIVLAPEGRNTTHFYTAPDATGTGWDNWYRQFTPDLQAAPENVDAAAIDHFIAAEVATGNVDTNRIYLSGWSNGAAMAYLYGLNRNNIAAIGVYSAPDPWRFSIDPCEQLPVVTVRGKKHQIPISNSRVPTYQVHNGCDIVGLCPNSKRMEKQLRKIGVPVTDQIIGLAQDPANPQNQQPARFCFAACGSNPNGDNRNGMGVQNHSRWPTQWTQSILDFFRDHPLSAQ